MDDKVKAIRKSDQVSLFLVLVSLISVGVIMIAKYHWKRRRLYRFARQMKGPKCYPIIGSAHLFRGTTEDILNTVMELKENYRPVTKVWLANHLFYAVSKPEHMEIIFNHPKALDKHVLYDFMKPVVGNGLVIAPVQTWKRNRKLLAPTFNQKILNNFVLTFYEQSAILANVLEEHTQKTVNIKEFLAKFTLDAVTETAMGIKLNEQTGDSEFGHCLDKITSCTFQRMFQIWYHPDFIFYNSPLGIEYTKVKDKFLNYTDRIIKERRISYRKQKELRKECPEAETEERNKSKTFLELLFDLYEEENLITDKYLRDEVTTFLIGGSDTTTIALSFAFVMLGMHPHYEQNVYDEIMEVIGPDRPVDHDDLPKLKYTERFLLESNRLFPIGPLVVRKHTGDIDLGDCVLPEGSASVLVILHTHRSERYWPDPLKFDPDRFLPEEVAKRHPYSFLSFTAGPRMCIGKKYGMMIMKVAVANIVRKFKFYTPYKSVEEIKLRQDILIQPVDGHMVRFELRDNSIGKG